MSRRHVSKQKSRGEENDFMLAIARGNGGISGSPNWVEAEGNTGTGTTTVSVTSGNIAKERSGQVRVSGIVTGIISANGNVTVSLLRDGTPIRALPALTVISTVAFSIPIQAIDTLPDTSNHTYTVQAVADGAHTITVGAAGIEIQAVELD